MHLSVLVVSYNVRDHLRRCLESLNGARDIVVVDNASSDGSAELAEEMLKPGRVVRMKGNEGFSAAVNAGARVAEGEALLLLNPDAHLAPGGLESISRALSNRPSVSAVGFRQVDEHGLFQLAIGPPPSFALELVRRAVQGGLDRRNRVLAGLLDALLARPIAVPWVAGSALLVRREAFDRIGGFDEGFFLYFEDIDFCLRLRADGGRVLYDPSVTVVHVRGASASNDPAAARRAYRASQLRFWEKHRGPTARRIVEAYQRVMGLSS